MNTAVLLKQKTNDYYMTDSTHYPCSTKNSSHQVLLVTVSWTLSLSLSCMSTPTLKPSNPALPHQTLPTRPSSLQNPWQRHRLRLEDVRHRLSASALQKVERETNRLRKNRRSRKFPKVPAASCMMSTRSLVEKKGRCTKSGGLCRVGSNFFYDQVSSLIFEKSFFCGRCNVITFCMHRT